MTLVPVDPKNEASVVTLLEHAAQWLSEAVHRGEPGEIAAVKAQMATAAEATKQLNLSKDIQLDALEMVRRAEYALGKAIRKGQSEGTILSRGQIVTAFDRHSGDRAVTMNSTKARPTDFASISELSGSQNTPGIYTIADAASPEEFEQAIEDAKAEGNLSRTNVGRKVQKAGPAAPSANGIGTARSPAIREQRADLIAELAAQGYTSRQMPPQVGVAEETVREIARAYGIDIPADRSSLGTRRINPAQIVENTATALEGLAMGIGLIDCRDVDPALASQWADSLDDSLKKLRSFANQIRKATQ